MDRRELLQWLVATGGLSAFNRLSPRDLSALGEEAHRRPRPLDGVALTLDAQEKRTVAAAAEAIIPRTSTPGATDAGVSAFVDLMLAEWYPAVDVERFRAGLQALDAASQTRTGALFADATSAQQVAHLKEIDALVAALRRTPAAAAGDHWFAMLKYLTVWGYCTSEVAMRETLHSYPRAMQYDGFAPVG